MRNQPRQALDEREREIDVAPGAQRKGRRLVTRPKSASLLEDLQAPRLVSTGELRELAATGYSQLVVSRQPPG